MSIEDQGKYLRFFLPLRRSPMKYVVIWRLGGRYTAASTVSRRYISFLLPTLAASDEVGTLSFSGCAPRIWSSWLALLYIGKVLVLLF